LIDRLAGIITPRGRMLTAYSGGVDSTVVAAAARRVLGRANAPVAVGDSASLPRHELAEARDIAQQLDLELVELQPGEQDDPNYRANAGDRCYFCKSHLYASLWALADERGIPFIANGTNLDDTGDHRPGLDAAADNRIVSPLLEAELGKAEVRAIAETLGLPNADKPAAACLASRIPHGTQVTAERLAMIEQAEDALRELGFRGFRVRHHERVARIEVPLDQVQRLVDRPIREQVVGRLTAIGYLYVTVDLAGFRSGSGNAMLQQVNAHAGAAE
ncbi:MAG: ATP-dependent sacrificial sulfur transferase LarE, partial [Deinococcus-Thermus bacterium]|nr:ATP-dependent sacrificial sulfur transferase LarE [Deinococcota bacterium]